MSNSLVTDLPNISSINGIHCPHEGCSYHKDSGKCLKSGLILEKHIANVHQEKKFTCDKCHKKFAFAWQLDHHLLSCGQIWKCTTCLKEYQERLSLIQHCSRQKHHLPEGVHRGNTHRNKGVKSSGTKVNSHVVGTTNNSVSPATSVNGPVFARILPRADASVDCLIQTDSKPAISSNTVNNVRVKPRQAQASTQTEKKKTSSSVQCHPVRNKRKKQITGASPYAQCTSGTQTVESTFSPSKVSNNMNSASVGSDLPMDFNVLESTTPESIDLLAEIVQEINNSNDPTTRCISDCSVQTDELDTPQTSSYCTTETQTPASEDWINSLDLNGDLDFSNCNLYDATYDIETQTNWSIDGTTQTDWSESQFLPNLFNFD